ncbi:hypothetical protein EV1_039375 [Malus domestica]
MGKWIHRPHRRFCRQEKLPDTLPLPISPSTSSPFCGWLRGLFSMLDKTRWYTLLGKAILHFGRAYTVVEGSRCLLRRHFKMQKKAFGQTSMASAVTPLCQIIDTIDWNPNIDRALVKEVDHEYFAPDEGEGKGKIGQTNKKAKYSDFVPLDEHNTILDDPRGRNQWHTNGDVTWERGITQGNGSAEKNAWEDSRNESRGWNQMGDSITPPKGWDTGVNPWEGG